MNRLAPDRSLIVLVDIQEKLAAAMPKAALDDMLRAATIMMEAAAALGVHAIATEQYPQGLGPTVASLRDRLVAANVPILPKMEFSAAEAPGFSIALAKHRPTHVVVLGMESHVCVFQTVRELADRGLTVHVPLDGVASRREDHRQAGLDLCRRAGATITTAETVVFDWLRKAGGEAFKRISRTLK